VVKELTWMMIKHCNVELLLGYWHVSLKLVILVNLGYFNILATYF